MDWFNRAFVSVTVVAILAMSSTASAQRYTQAPAVSACQKSGTTGTATFAYEELYNSSTTENMYIDCGDSSSWETVGSYVLEASIWLFDESPTQNTSCWMRVIDSLGLTWYTGATKSTTGSSTSIQLLSWDPVGQYGNASFGCNIPKQTSGGAASGVGSITVRHNF